MGQNGQNRAKGFWVLQDPWTYFVFSTSDFCSVFPFLALINTCLAFIVVLTICLTFFTMPVTGTLIWLSALDFSLCDALTSQVKRLTKSYDLKDKVSCLCKYLIHILGASLAAVLKNSNLSKDDNSKMEKVMQTKRAAELFVMFKQTDRYLCFCFVFYDQKLSFSLQVSHKQGSIQFMNPNSDTKFNCYGLASGLCKSNTPSSICPSTKDMPWYLFFLATLQQPAAFHTIKQQIPEEKTREEKSWEGRPSSLELKWGRRNKFSRKHTFVEHTNMNTFPHRYTCQVIYMHTGQHKHTYNTHKPHICT